MFDQHRYDGLERFSLTKWSELSNAEVMNAIRANRLAAGRPRCKTIVWSFLGKRSLATNSLALMDTPSVGVQSLPIQSIEYAFDLYRFVSALYRLRIGADANPEEHRKTLIRSAISAPISNAAFCKLFTTLVCLKVSI